MDAHRDSWVEGETCICGLGTCDVAPLLTSSTSSSTRSLALQSHETQCQNGSSIKRSDRDTNAFLRAVVWDDDNDLLLRCGKDSKLNIWHIFAFSAGDLQPYQDKDESEVTEEAETMMRLMSSREEPEKQSRKNRCRRMAEEDGDGEKGDEESMDEEGMDAGNKIEDERGRQASVFLR
ncbi:hypothetical protein CPB83DRAFT_899943 [Crepidotus variabilis]|uniref:Uncharacterized protein n=1 Tax=Crepidotus variabilis TaxID=179855 RepID=A0A9P6JI80_9AGAR|nr:hypothetical protein CPB83DRAFT_899943 [Crepidotus variabilis]